MKNLDDNLDKIKEYLGNREKTGIRRHMADTHGDFIKECVESRRVEVRWIPTKENLADIMTKPLPAKAHTYLRDKLLNLK